MIYALEGKEMNLDYFAVTDEINMSDDLLKDEARKHRL